MNGIEFYEMCCVFWKYVCEKTTFQFYFRFMLIMQRDKKNSASRQLLVIPPDSVTRLISFAGLNFNKLPPLF